MKIGSWFEIDVGEVIAIGVTIFSTVTVVALCWKAKIEAEHQLVPPPLQHLGGCC